MVARLGQYITLRTILRTFFLILLAGAIASYALFQGRHMIEGPVIEVLRDTYDGTSATVALEGTAENIVALSLNGRPIYTDDEGRWSETVVLPVGYTIVTFVAEDRYGRKASLERSYVRESADITTRNITWHSKRK